MTFAQDEIDQTAWRGRWMSSVALVGALFLIGLLGLVSLSSNSRDAALDLERNTYTVMQLARSTDASIARAEAALGRYVLDQDQATGTAYYNEWRSADRQISLLRSLVRADADQLRRVTQLRRLFNQRGMELARAAVASQRREGTSGLSLFYSASLAPTLWQIRSQLDGIVRAGRQTLDERVAASTAAANRADRLTSWLGLVAVAISALAIALSYSAYRAFAEGRIARSEADIEAERAAELDRAVQARTAELSDAYARLKAEGAERAAAEARLRQAQKMDAVGQLTGGIAHDFNNMLAVVVGGLDLAKRRLRSSPREVEMHLDNAMEGATRAAALTRRLLAFARSEPLLPEGVDPADLIEKMLELIDRTIGERVTIHTRFPVDVWHVFADPTGLENAIVNLCVNGRDAMAATGDLGITVENVTLRRGQVAALEASDFVRIAVSDTGCGISPEHLERVFEPFFTTKDVGKGTGLGLSQVFGFARQSGGDVAIGSQVGQGTTVSIYLPRALGAAAPAPAPRAFVPEQMPVAAQAGAGGGARILVVEDDPRVSRATVGALQELGHFPVSVVGGAEAIQVLERGDGFDLIVTDVMMPGMTGVELARALDRRHPDQRVLFVTGYVGEAGTMDELGGRDLLRKPFTVAQLSAAVEQALARSPSLEQAAE